MSHLFGLWLSTKKSVGLFSCRSAKKTIVINNYYVENDDESVFAGLLEAVIDEFQDTNKILEAVVQKIHESFFSVQNFEIERMWSTYLKMRMKNEKN